MVVTHLFQILAFTAMEAPTSLDPRAITEEKNKVFRSMLPIAPDDVVRGQYTGYVDEPGVSPDSETETFIALRCFVDNWRWAGVPFYLRTGKKLAEGQRIISIAFKEPPQSMFPEGSGIGQHGPDHLTFDLADQGKMSLSFYGKRPGPGFRLDKLSMQFAIAETGWAGSVLEAYERLILDAVKGNHTLFTTAEGVERLWEVSAPLLEDMPPVRPYAEGSWGPNQIHQLIAPHTWRLPFERTWRDKRVSVDLFGDLVEQYLEFAGTPPLTPRASRRGRWRWPRTRRCCPGSPGCPGSSSSPTSSSPPLAGTGCPPPGRTPACARPCWAMTGGSRRPSGAGVPRPTRWAGWPPCFLLSGWSPATATEPLALVEVGASAGLCLYPRPVSLPLATARPGGAGD